MRAGEGEKSEGSQAKESQHCGYLMRIQYMNALFSTISKLVKEPFTSIGNWLVFASSLMPLAVQYPCDSSESIRSRGDQSNW
jgi:hypothetical protein